VLPLRHGTATARLCVVKEKEERKGKKKRKRKKERRKGNRKLNYPFFRNCDL
jgi:hypothetical protein